MRGGGGRKGVWGGREYIVKIYPSPRNMPNIILEPGRVDLFHPSLPPIYM